MTDMINLNADDWNADMYSNMFSSDVDGDNLILFLIDCSGSVGGTVLGSIKNIMEEISSEHDNSNTKIMVAQLSKSVQWLNETPVAIGTFTNWRKLTSGGILDLGYCFKMIANKVNSDDWDAVEKSAKVIKFILISDGMSADFYEEGLKLLKATKAFRKAKKYAVNLCDVSWTIQQDIKEFRVLKNFTENSECFFDMSSMDSEKVEKALEKIIFG